MDNQYKSLMDVFHGAINQAVTGKGKKRHATDENFEDQLICVIPKILGKESVPGINGVLFQAIKKIIESNRLEKNAAIREIYGAINYLAAAVIIRRK